MATIDVEQLEKIEELISLLKEHPEITLVQSNNVIAKVTSLTSKSISQGRRIPNLHPQIWISDDFDEQLPEEYWINGTI